jgi:hypothetical protein
MPWFDQIDFKNNQIITLHRTSERKWFASTSTHNYMCAHVPSSTNVDMSVFNHHCQNLQLSADDKH